MLRYFRSSPNAARRDGERTPRPFLRVGRAEAGNSESLRLASDALDHFTIDDATPLSLCAVIGAARQVNLFRLRT
jgi:hypothetical protein